MAQNFFFFYTHAISVHMPSLVEEKHLGCQCTPGLREETEEPWHINTLPLFSKLFFLSHIHTHTPGQEQEPQRWSGMLRLPISLIAEKVKLPSPAGLLRRRTDRLLFCLSPFPCGFKPLQYFFSSSGGKPTGEDWYISNQHSLMQALGESNKVHKGSRVFKQSTLSTCCSSFLMHSFMHICAGIQSASHACSRVSVHIECQNVTSNMEGFQKCPRTWQFCVQKRLVYEATVT